VLAELLGELKSGGLCSLDEVRVWLMNGKRVGASLTLPTVRLYCRKLGFDLPARIKSTKKTVGRDRKYQWTAEQIAQLKSCVPSLGHTRSTALMKVGTEETTILNVAYKCGVPYWRLRLDLRYFTSGRLQRLGHRGPGGNIPLAEGKLRAFYQWCNRKYQSTGKPPSAAAAQGFLQSRKCRTPMLRRTVYNYLSKWRKSHAIAPRIYRVNKVRMAR
jgi:hypothetical protein